MYVNNILTSGRPEHEVSAAENSIYDFLEKAGVNFARAEHEEAATIELCLTVEKILGAHICKNLLLCNRTATDFYLLIMPGSKPFKTKYLSAQIGSSRLSFADSSYMEGFLNTKPGSLSVLGLLFDKEKRVRLLIDKDIRAYEYLGFHPCKNTATLRFSTTDLFDKIIPALGHEPTEVELKTDES